LSRISPDLKAVMIQGEMTDPRPITVHATGSRVTGITLTAASLATADGFRQFPRANILVSAPQSRSEIDATKQRTAEHSMPPVGAPFPEVEADKDGSQDVFFDSRGVACGQYVGKVYLRYGVNSLEIPADVSVKSDWVLPLVV